MILRGFLRVIGSFFSLPVLFVKNTFTFLEKTGQEGLQGEASDESIPFLNWLFVAGRVVIVAIAGVWILGSTIVWSLAGPEFFIPGLIYGAVGAFFWIWIAALGLEMLSLGVVLVNNTKEILWNIKKT